MPVTDIKITDLPETPEIPSPGIYVDLNYDHGNMTDRAGPFPEDKKHLLVEFLNLLENMLARYSNGLTSKTGYTDVPNYEKWFSEEKSPNKNSGKNPDQAFRDSLGLKIRYVPNAFNRPALFTGYWAYYHNGTSLSRFPVQVIKN